MKKLAVCATTVLLAATACSLPSSTEHALPGASVHIPSNCGREVILPKAPRRVVAVKSSAVEILAALEARSSIVGVAYTDAPVPEILGGESGLNHISDKLPSQEKILELQPDLVVAGWESNFGRSGIGERNSLERSGTATYVLPTACENHSALTFADIFDLIRETGHILDREGQAEEIVRDQRSRLERIRKDPRKLRILWYSSGTKSPFVAGGTGAPDMILKAVGGRNIMSDLGKPWAPTSWEKVVERDPQVIVLADSTWSPAEKKRHKILTDPALRDVTAVKNQAFVVLPFATTEAGVRTVEGAERLSAALAMMKGSNA